MWSNGEAKLICSTRIILQDGEIIFDDAKYSQVWYDVELISNYLKFVCPNLQRKL